MSGIELSDRKFLISIDPGINNCGLSVFLMGEQFEVIESHLVNNTRAFDPHYKEIEKIHGTRTTKILKIITKLEKLIDKFKVTDLIVEAPFYSSLTPQAYGSLLEVILGIKYLVVMPRQLNMSLIEPTAVKRLFTQKGNATKVLMKEFLISRIKNNDLIVNLDVETLSEHEIDSIAVGFVYWLNNKLKPEV